MQDVQQLSKRAGQYVRPEEPAKQAIPDPFLRQLVHGSNQNKLKKLHAELIAGADEAELSLAKRSQSLQESLAALLQAFDAGQDVQPPVALSSCHWTDYARHADALCPAQRHQQRAWSCGTCTASAEHASPDATRAWRRLMTLACAERHKHAESLQQLAASSPEAQPAAAAAAEAARAQQATQRELDAQLALNRTLLAQLKQACPHGSPCRLKLHGLGGLAGLVSRLIAPEAPPSTGLCPVWPRCAAVRPVT